MRLRFIAACAVALCILALPANALAQRALHWDNVEVAAHLDAEDRLVVTETQTMVFSGDWKSASRTYVLLYQLSNTLLRDAAPKNGDFYTLANIHRGPQKALWTLLPVALAIGAAALYLSRWADSGIEPASDAFIVGVVMLALSVLFAGVGALKSTQHRAALAFRRMLASGREFFIAELAKERPALRDEWFPWILAFGLGEQMDDWSAKRERKSTNRSSVDSTSPGSFGSGESSGSGTWTGFAGGRSGGGGGGGW